MFARGGKLSVFLPKHLSKDFPSLSRLIILKKTVIIAENCCSNLISCGFSGKQKIGYVGFSLLILSETALLSSKCT